MQPVEPTASCTSVRSFGHMRTHEPGPAKRRSIAEPARPNGDEPIPVMAKQVPLGFYRPGHHLLHARVRIPDEPGHLVRTLAVLPVPQVNLIHLSVSNGTSHGIATVNIFAEIDQRMTARRVEEALRKVPGARQVRVRMDSDGLLIDPSYPLAVPDWHQAVLLGRSNLAHMLDHIRTKMGSGGAALLYSEGFTFAGASYEEDARTMSAEYVTHHLPYVHGFISASGLAHVEGTEVDPEGKGVTVRVTDNFECVEHTSSTPYSQFFRGLLAGYWSGIWNHLPVSCTETQCVAAGAPACEFRIEPAPTERMGEAPLAE